MLAKDVQSLFRWAHTLQFADLHHDYDRTVSKGHGRFEIRKCRTIFNPTFLGDL